MSAPLVRRELRARPGRVALVGFTVVVAVAFTTGAFGFSEQLTQLLSPAAADVRDASIPEGSVLLTATTDALTTPTALDEALLERVGAVPGVAIASGSYDQPVSFVPARGRQQGLPPVLRGVVLASSSQTGRWNVVAGRAPRGPNEVALDAAGLDVADAPGPGEFRLLQFPIGTLLVEIVGVVAPAATEGGASPPGVPASAAALGSAHVILDPAVAPQLLDAVGRVDRITVVPVPGEDPDELAARIRRSVPDGLRVTATTDRTAETQHTIQAINDGVQTATLAFAGLTVLVASLVVANVYSVLVAQRTREFGLLRALGASRRQLVRAVVSEALVIGLAAAAIGGVLGVVLAFSAARVVRVASVSVGFVATPSMAGVALVVGVAITLIGSVWPALRASRVSPLDALSDSRAGADHHARGWIGASATVAGVGLVWWGLGGGQGTTGWRTAALGIGALVAFVGLALLSRWIVRPLTVVLGLPLRAVGRMSARLGVGNARRQPSRTAGAASTLMVGLALVASVATVGASARQTIDRQVRSAGNADLYVERRGVVRVSPSSMELALRTVVPGIVDLAEVISVDGVVIGPGGTETNVVASGLDRAARMVDLDLVAGGPRSGGEDGVMISESAAKRLDVTEGSTVELRSTSGETISLPVVAVYANTSVFGPVIVSRAAAERINADGTFELAALQVDGVSVERAQRRARGAARNFSKVGVSTPVEFGQLSTTVADTVLRVIYVLLVGSLGIGFLGLAGTLALSTLERRRELVMLRAVGASVSQIRAMIWVEATLIGAIAVVVGMGLGTVAGRLGTTVAPESVIGASVIPWLQLAGVALAAVLTSWLTSLAVARGAGRVPPAEAGRE